MSEKRAIAHNDSKPLSDAGRRNTRRKQASKWFFPAVRYKCTHLKRRRNAPQCIGVLLLLFFFYRYALSPHLCENQCNYWSFFFPFTGCAFSSAVCKPGFDKDASYLLRTFYKGLFPYQLFCRYLLFPKT